MKQAFLLVALLLFSAVAIYVFNFRQHDEPTNISDENAKPVLSQNLPKPSDPINQKILEPPADTVEVVKLFESLKTAGDVLDLSDALLSEGRDGLAKDILKYLHARCGHLDGYEPVESIWSKKLDKYCEDYDRSQYDLIMSTTIENPLIVPDFNLSLDESIENIQEASDKFIDMLSQIQSRSALGRASNTMRFFSEELGMPLQLGQDSKVINPLDLEYVQTMALNLYACEIFGGCGSNDYLTLEICEISNQCQPGWTTYDFYQNTFSPVYFEQIINILNHLRSRIPGH